MLSLGTPLLRTRTVLLYNVLFALCYSWSTMNVPDLTHGQDIWKDYMTCRKGNSFFLFLFTQYPCSSLCQLYPSLYKAFHCSEILDRHRNLCGSQILYLRVKLLAGLTESSSLRSTDQVGCNGEVAEIGLNVRFCGCTVYVA